MNSELSFLGDNQVKFAIEKKDKLDETKCKRGRNSTFVYIIIVLKQTEGKIIYVLMSSIQLNSICFAFILFSFNHCFPFGLWLWEFGTV